MDARGDAGKEWTRFYTALTAEFGVDIDTGGPNFGMEHLPHPPRLLHRLPSPGLDTIACDGARATLVGARTRVSWPTRGELRHLPVVDPTPAYPHSLMWRVGDRHPGLTAFCTYLAELPGARHERNWVPRWA